MVLTESWGNSGTTAAGSSWQSLAKFLVKSRVPSGANVLGSAWGRHVESRLVSVTCWGILGRFPWELLGEGLQSPREGPTKFCGAFMDDCLEESLGRCCKVRGESDRIPGASLGRLPLGGIPRTEKCL